MADSLCLRLDAFGGCLPLDRRTWTAGENGAVGGQL
jgi:hypothetical protein